MSLWPSPKRVVYLVMLSSFVVAPSMFLAMLLPSVTLREPSYMQGSSCYDQFSTYLPCPRPLVSIVIPCSRCASTIARSVLSVELQSYLMREILIVNDSPEDDKTNAALRLLPSTALVLRNARKGVSAARNFGLAKARGEYVLFLDADDEILPDAIALLLVKLLSSPASVYAFSSQWLKGFINSIWLPQPYNGYDLLWRNIPSSCALVRRDSALSVKGYDEGLRDGMEDWDFWLRFAEHGHRGVLLPVPVFIYHTRKESRSHQRGEKEELSIRGQLVQAHLASLYNISRLHSIKQIWRPLILVLIVSDGSNCCEAVGKQTLTDFQVLCLASQHYSLNCSDTNMMLSNDSLASTLKKVISSRSLDYFVLLNIGWKLTAMALEKLVLPFLTSDVSSRLGFSYSAWYHDSMPTFTSWDPMRLRRENLLANSLTLFAVKAVLNAGALEGDCACGNLDLLGLVQRLLSSGYAGHLVPEILHTTDGLSPSHSSLESFLALRRRNPSFYGLPSKMVPSTVTLSSIENDASHVSIMIEQQKLIWESRALREGLQIHSSHRFNEPIPFNSDYWFGDLVNVLVVVDDSNDIKLGRLTSIGQLRFFCACIRCHNATFEGEVFSLAGLIPSTSFLGGSMVRRIIEYIIMTRAIDFIVALDDSGLGVRVLLEWARYISPATGEVQWLLPSPSLGFFTFHNLSRVMDCTTQCIGNSLPVVNCPWGVSLHRSDRYFTYLLRLMNVPLFWNEPNTYSTITNLTLKRLEDPPEWSVGIRLLAIGSAQESHERVFSILEWVCLQPLHHDFTLYFHVLKEGTAVLNCDSEPTLLDGSILPTSSWLPMETIQTRILCPHFDGTLTAEFGWAIHNTSWSNLPLLGSKRSYSHRYPFF